VNDDIRTRKRPAVSKADKSQRRYEILSAAKNVFSRNGFHATTVGDIAREAGLAYGSVYQYFDSKEDLFHALMSVEADALRAHVVAAINASRDQPEESWKPLRAIVRATLEFFEADAATTTLLLRDAYVLGGSFEKHLGKIYERFLEEMEGQMADAQPHGRVLGAPPRLVAFSISVLIGQLAHRRLTTDDGVTAAEVADFVVSLLGNSAPESSR
jgi:AcrR family transcriptional regulator